MAKENAKIEYDFEEDILNLSRSKNSQASLEVGDFILDVDFNGFISSIEILNASENLGISKELLKKVKNAKLGILYKPDYIFVTIVFNFERIEKDIRIPLTIDLGHKQIKKQEIIFA